MQNVCKKPAGIGAHLGLRREKPQALDFVFLPTHSALKVNGRRYGYHLCWMFPQLGGDALAWKSPPPKAWWALMEFCGQGTKCVGSV